MQNTATYDRVEAAQHFSKVLPSAWVEAGSGVGNVRFDQDVVDTDVLDQLRGTDFSNQNMTEMWSRK